MSLRSEKDKEPTYLQSLLGSASYKLPDQADLARYLSGLQGVYSEFKYNNPDNPVLDDYFRQHRGVSHNIIDLTSSATNLPPYEPAIRAAMEASAAKDGEMHGRIRSLLEESRHTSEACAYLTDIRDQLSMVSPRGLDEVPASTLSQVLAGILADMKPEAITAVQDAYEKAHRALDPVVKDVIRHCSDRDYAPRLPSGRTELRALKENFLELIILACDERLTGTLTKSEGLVDKSRRLEREVVEENQRVPKGNKLVEMATEINDKSLKPAVIKLMKHLQGIEPDTIKPENLCLCNGSSTHLMDVALKTLVQTGKARAGTPKKKLLLFSLAWDGLKTIAADANMEPSLIDGSVNAQALDEHIQKHILQGKFADDPIKANAEVRKQVGALVMNIPENPIGKIPSDKEMQALAAVVKKYDLPVVIVDEIFAAPGHRSLLTYPDMSERCYVISSTSKNINSQNKVAFGYSQNKDFARLVRDGMDASKHMHPIQSVYHGVVLEETPRSYYEGNQEQYARKRRLVSETMVQTNKELKLEKGMQWLEEPNYGCLGVVTIPRELTDACGIKNSCQLAEYIYKLSGVQAMPTGDVNPNAERPLGLRINFSENDHMLIEAIGRIGVAMQHMQQKKPYKDIEGNKYRGRSSRETGFGMMGSIAEIVSSMFNRGHQGGGYDS